MRFRRVLFPIIRLFQCTGLCPISVYGSNSKSTLKKKSIGFAILSAFIFFVQLFVCVHYFVHSDYYLNWSKSIILSCITLFVSFTLRLHAFAVTIESFAKRILQSQMLEKFDEIETIFTRKLKIKTNDDHLLNRGRRFIIIWIVKYIFLVSIIFFGAILVFSWRYLYQLVMTMAPFFISTLFYAQLMTYLDIIEYNMEEINTSLSKLMDKPQIYWHRQQRNAMLTTEVYDICQQLIYLRICYCKTWEATMLINECVRWSLLFAINNDFVLYVTNMFWVLWCLVNVSFDNRISMVIFLTWITINMSHFVLISRVCEQILDQVSACNSHNNMIKLIQS